MAENPIRKDDLIEFEDIQRGLNELIATLEKLSTVLHDDLKVSADQVEKSLQGVNAATKQGQETIKSASVAADQLAEENKVLTQQDKQLLQAKIKLKHATSDEAKELIKLKSELQRTNKETKDQIRYADSEAGSINNLRAKVKQLTAEYNKLGNPSRKTTKELKRTTDQLKKQEKAIGNNTRNVGNYGDALSSLGGPIGATIGGIQRMTKAAIKFIATPIGAVIAAVALAVGALSQWFTRTEKGQDALNVSSQKFKVVLQNILDITSKLGKAIFDAFTKPREAMAKLDAGAKKFFKGVGDLIKGEKTLKDVGEGLKNTWNKARDGLRKFGDEQRREIKTAEELARIENNTIKLERELTVERAKIQAKISSLREDAEKRDEYSAEQRLKFVDEAIALEDKLFKKEEEIAQNRLLIQRERNKLSDSNRQDLQAEADLEATLIGLQTSRDRAQRTVESKRQALFRERKTENAAFYKLEKKQIDKNIADQINGIDEIKATALKKVRQANVDELAMAEAHAEALKQIDREILEDKIRGVAEGAAIGLDILGKSISSFASLVEGAKQRELSAAGDNAKAREAIELKFAKKQQLLAIGQATVNGALAVTEIWKKWAANPVLAGILTGIVAAQTIGEIAVIKNQKFAHGGSGEIGQGVLQGHTHASGGVQIPGIGEAEKGEYLSIFSRKATAMYGTDMLEGVTNSINAGQFHDVWSNLNTSMSKADPYTKLMYELMLNTPQTFSHDGKIYRQYPNRTRMN